MELKAALANEEIRVKDVAFDVDVVSALSGDVITLDGNDGNFFDIYLNRPKTRITMPINFRNGETYRFQIRQDMVGGRVINWGTKVDNFGLECSIYPSATEVEIIIESGYFDWETISDRPGRQSFLFIDGFISPVNNAGGLKVKNYDEDESSIICYAPDWDMVEEELTTDVDISVENNFFFTDEKGDNWIGQFPFGVTQFEFYTTTNGASGLLNKNGVYSNSLYQKAKVRFEEQLTDDFINGNDDGLLNWREGNSNGTTNVSNADIDGGHHGILYQRLNAGATADGRTSTTMGSKMFDVSNMRVAIEGICKFNANSLQTADVKYYFGWSDETQFHAANNGAYFEIVADGSTEGKGRIYCVTIKSGSRTVHDTGIDIAEDQWFQMFIGIPPNGGGIHFVVNDITAHHANRSTFGIAEKVTCGFGQYYDYTGTPLPNNKDWFIDTFSLKYRLNTDRI